MRCPYCGNAQTAAIRCCEADDGVRRVRACAACGREFTTTERAETGMPMVVKRDGRREEYSRSKLARSVRLACERRPISAEAIARLVERVEQRVLEDGAAAVTSQRIGEAVLEELRGLDDVAYLRFASFFRAFSSAGAFVEAAEELLAWRQRSAAARLQLSFDFDADQPHWN